MVSGAMAKKLSLIIPLYRETRETIDKIVEAMKNLQYPDKELIFVFEPEERHLAQLVRAKGFKAILTEGGPKSKANSLNVGFKASTGDIIAIYDADNEPEPEQALKAIRVLEEGHYDVVCGYILSATDTFFQRMRTIDLMDYCSSITVKELPIIFGFSHYMRREVVEDIGGWEGDTVIEDSDFSMKLNLKGYKIGIIDSPIYAESNRGLKNIFLQRARWMKGGYQLGGKWWGKTSALPFRKRLEFIMMSTSRYTSLLILPLLSLALYSTYLLLSGVRAYYLWFLPLLYLIDYASILFIVTRRQLVKIEGISIIDYLVYPIYRWIFWASAMIAGYIELKRKPLYWRRVER